MPLQVRAKVAINQIIWIGSVQPHEIGVSRRVLEDLEPLLERVGVAFVKLFVKSKDDLQYQLSIIKKDTQRGLKPLVHFDMHGDEIQGLWIAHTNEYMSWDSLAKELQAININTSNGLCVISTACFGFHLARRSNVTEQAIFHTLIGPVGLLTLGEIESRVVRFYRELFETSNIVRAYDVALRPVMLLFHSEQIFTVGIIRYFKQGCMGKGKKERIDELIADLVRSGMPANRKNLRLARSRAKHDFKPTPEVVQKYAAVHLIGQPYTVPFSEIRRVLYDNEELELYL